MRAVASWNRRRVCGSCPTSHATFSKSLSTTHRFVSASEAISHRHLEPEIPNTRASRVKSIFEHFQLGFGMVFRPHDSKMPNPTVEGIGKVSLSTRYFY